MALFGGREMRECATCGRISCNHTVDEQMYGVNIPQKFVEVSKPEPKNFIEVSTQVSIHLEQDQKEKWQSLVNNRYHGTSRIPLDVQVSQECKDAHWWINCGKNIPIKVRLYDDGSYEVISQNYFRQSHPL